MNKLNDFRQRILRRIMEHDTHHLETFCAFAFIGWGAWVACPWLDTFSGTILFTKLAPLMPEVGWGLLYLTIGIIQLAALLRLRTQARGWIAFGGAIAWFFLAIFSWLGKFSAPSGIIYFTYGLAEGLIYLHNSGLHHNGWEAIDE